MNELSVAPLCLSILYESKKPAHAGFVGWEYCLADSMQPPDDIWNLPRPTEWHYFAKSSMNLTNCLISAFLAPFGSLAGMGIPPQLPEEPCETAITKPSSKSYSLPPSVYLVAPLYLLDTSLHAGPTDFFSISWQISQSCFLVSSGISTAHAHCVTAKANAATILPNSVLMNSLLLNLPHILTDMAAAPPQKMNAAVSAPSDETTGHSTRLCHNHSQVAGYPPWGESDVVSLRDVHVDPRCQLSKFAFRQRCLLLVVGRSLQ